jgi:hypothetical protein
MSGFNCMKHGFFFEKELLLGKCPECAIERGAKTMARDDISRPVDPSIMTISNHGRPLVTISPDGSIEFGPDYKPDEAARIFWSAISDEYKRFLDWRDSKAGSSK